MRKWTIAKIAWWIAAILLLLPAWAVRSPLMHNAHPRPLIIALAGVAVLAVINRWFRAPWRWRLIPLALAAVIALRQEITFHQHRRQVLNADNASLQRLGRHLIVGFDRFEELVPLVKRGAIGGMFITSRNVAGISAEQIRQFIDQLQAIQASENRPPLLVMADQEGGPVSRLSPPLPQMPSLAQLIAQAHGVQERDALVESYAATQAQALASLGVNVNLGPVVDLAMASPRIDPYSKISARAISADPSVVAAVARRYSQELAKKKVWATLKHFPGLGRVEADTHLWAATLDTDAATLEATDWLPYRETLGHVAGQSLVMVAHVRLSAVDPNNLASYSPKIVQGILRERFHHQGLVITDDLCMAPIAYGSGGMGRAAVDSLNAGVDLLLVSWDPEQYFEVMYRLLAAEQSGRLAAQTEKQSGQRLERLLKQIN